MINSNDPDPRSTLIHEVQHAIQPLEGMDTGYSPEQARDVLRRRYGNTLSEAELERRAAEMYNLRKGEVDARVAETRLYMTEDQRLIVRPSNNADVQDGVWANRVEGSYTNDSAQQNARGDSPVSRIRQEAPRRGAGEITQGASRLDGVADRASGDENLRGLGTRGTNDNASGYAEYDTRRDSVLYREPRQAPSEDRGGLQQEASRLDGGANSELYEGRSDRLSDYTQQPTRRPSIINTSEEARREGERVVSEGTKTRTQLDRLLERNGGTGLGQRVLDTVVPVLFNSNRTVARILGWDVFDKLERVLATAPRQSCICHRARQSRPWA